MKTSGQNIRSDKDGVTLTNPKKKTMRTFMWPVLQLSRRTMASTNFLKTKDSAKTTCHDISDFTGKRLDSHTYVYKILQACVEKKTLTEGKLVHAQISERGLMADRLLGNTIINMYAKCGCLLDACKVFDEMSERNICSWTMMIAAYARHGFPEGALEIFGRMWQRGVQPNQFTFASVLRACANLEALEEGVEIHEDVIRRGFVSDVVVENALVDMYGKCGCIEIARQVFEKMSERDMVSWTTMIAGYAQVGYLDEALELFDRMKERDLFCWTVMIAAFAQGGLGYKAVEFFWQLELSGLRPDAKAFSSVLAACADLEALEKGIKIHGKIIRRGFESDVVVVNALIDMYAKCRNMEQACELFSKMQRRDIVSWTAIITGYKHNGFGEEALKLFRQMQVAGVESNHNAFTSILSACAEFSYLRQGMQIHGKLISNGIQADVTVASVLIGMYTKCGRIEEARELFDNMHERDIVCWTAMIAGYSQNGLGEDALKLFQQMLLAGMIPNSKSLASFLPVCSKLAALEQGMEIHGRIIRSGFKSDTTSTNALIDMYVKCGSIEKAWVLFNEMHPRDAFSWTAMISGYAQNGMGEEALKLFQQMQLEGMKPNLKTFTSVIATCANLASLEKGMEIHENIIESGSHPDVILVNALIDMYAKCGNIQKARELFDKMQYRDIVSWNTMIAGYAMHGHGLETLELFEQMKHCDVKPDHITLLGVLTACCHAGLVDEGYWFFNCMGKYYNITPAMEHYSCMVDLLGRAGHLDEAQGFIDKMPVKPDASVWSRLLVACRIHANIGLGESVAERIFELDSENDAPYVVLSNMYAAAGRWVDIEKIRKMMKHRGLRKTPGCSWIEVHKEVHTFFVGDLSTPTSEENIYKVVNLVFGKQRP